MSCIEVINWLECDTLTPLPAADLPALWKQRVPTPLHQSSEATELRAHAELSNGWMKPYSSCMWVDTAAPR